MSTPTLRWYLVKKFVAATVAVFALCCLLIFMIDFVEMLRRSGKYGDIGLARVVKLTALRLPAYAELLITFAILVATIATLLQLNRKSELSVMRAGGMSAWQFIRPGIYVAIGFGVLGVLVYNPMAAAARAEAERLHAKYYGQESSFLQGRSRSWLRQDSVDGASVIHGAAVTNNGMSLTTVTAFRFDGTGGLLERISAESAELRDGYWELSGAWVTQPGLPPRQYGTYFLATYLSPERVRDALGSVISLSVWQLPTMIDLAKKAGLSSASFEVQLHLLLSRPFLLIAMVLLGACVSLGSFRSGGTQTMVLFGMGGGFAFFLMAELSRQVGLAGLVDPWIAVWTPVAVAWLATATVLLCQEDG